MKSVLRKLVETPGPSGYESAVRGLVRDEIAGLADRYQVDNLGNLLAQVGAKTARGARIMVLTPLDEPGLMISHVDSRGRAHFTPFGHLAPEIYAGRPVRFLNGAQGVIGCSDAKFCVSARDGFGSLFIDFGCTGPENCPAHPGDVAVIDAPWIELDGHVAGKALESRLGAAILIETLRRLKTASQPSLNEIHFVFTVQNGVGQRGAGAAGFRVTPDIAIGIGVTPERDLSAVETRLGAGLGAGPVIRLRDAEMLCDRRLIDWMAHSAEAAGIPYQYEAPDGTTSVARPVQLSGVGVPAGHLSLACRYPGSLIEMIDLEDAYHLVELLVQLLLNEAPL